MNKAGTPSMEELLKKKQAYSGQKEDKYTFTIEQLQQHLYKPEDDTDKLLKQVRLRRELIKEQQDALKLAKSRYITIQEPTNPVIGWVIIFLVILFVRYVIL